MDWKYFLIRFAWVFVGFLVGWLTCALLVTRRDG